MGYTDEAGPEGSPLFDASPQTVADLQRLRDLAIQRGNAFKGTTAARTAWATDGFAAEGHLWYDTDLDAVYLYTGADWVLLVRPGGLYRVRPDAVTGTGVSIGSQGQVILTAVPASTVIQIRGIFSSLFRNCKGFATFTSKPSAQVTVQGIVGTGVVGGTAYSFSRQNYVGGGRGDTQGTLQTSFLEGFIPIQGTAGASEFTFLSPNAPEPTYLLTQMGHLGGVTGVTNLSAALNSNDQLTGLQITTGAGGTTTGEIRFYGMT